MDRKTVLLMACRDMLVKCRNSHHVISPMETTVFYDEADCDGSCLLDDIDDELRLLSCAPVSAADIAAVLPDNAPRCLSCWSADVAYSIHCRNCGADHVTRT